MKVTLLVFMMLLNSIAAKAMTSYYLGAPDEAKNYFQNLERSEFLIDQEASKARICGIWHFADGRKQIFEYSFDLENEALLYKGNDIGRLSKFGLFFRLDSNMGTVSFDMGWNKRKGTFGLNYWDNISEGLFFMKGSIKDAPSEDLTKACEQ